MKLSRRTAWIEQHSAFHRSLERARGRSEIIDLTSSNPTLAGFRHPEAVYRSLIETDCTIYAPRPLGHLGARRAVSEYYAKRSIILPAERIWLYASTSEAYAQLLALFCDPGDVVLVPRPGYPLLDVLGDIADVRRVPYPLVCDGRWHIDFHGLRRALDGESRVRLIIAVAPNNPTGNYLGVDELDELETICATRDVPLIVDEVFADYPLSVPEGRIRHVRTKSCTCFVLSGLSKVAALPQMKLSWIAVHGPGASDDILVRAEHLSDAFLSVAAPVQLALEHLLAAAEPMQVRIRERLLHNLRHLQERTLGAPLETLAVEGGWTALLRLPRIDGRDAEAWAVDLLEQGHVVVHPGHFFDLPDPPRVAISLLTPPRDLERGLERLLDLVDRRC